jgi:hypothetical protein
MNQSDWIDILARSDSLRPVINIQDARAAVRLELWYSAACGEAPVGIVSHPDYLIGKPIHVID